MYCIKCGVELQKGADHCPLCGLKVYHPELTEEKEPSLYPAYTGLEETKSSRSLMFILTLLCVIPVMVCMIVDLRISQGIRWSGYVMVSIAAGYMSFLFPLWFRKPNPVIFLPIGMLAILGLLAYICGANGGHWFFSFALPVWGVVLALLETMTVLLRYAVKNARHRIAVILGSGTIAIGFICVFIEFFISLAFGTAMTWWSGIPLSVQLILGLILILIGSNRRIRQSLYKRFFI